MGRQFLIVWLPLGLVCATFFLGYLRLSRFAGFLLVWFSLIVLIALLAGLNIISGPEGMLPAIFLALLGGFMIPPSIWLAFLFGVTTSDPVAPSPATRTYQAYSNLSPKEKRAVHKAFGIFGQLGLSILTKQLSKRDWI